MLNSLSVAQLAKRIQVALGQQPADIVLKNANVVDIFCHKIYQCDIAIVEGTIVGLGQYDCDNNVDCTGQYVMPSFYDTHIHFESSMTTPNVYLSEAIPRGITMLNADCHEIANVCGIDGLNFMKECCKQAPIDINFMLPSCVPATPFEHSNANISGQNTCELMQGGEYFGLGEMMNYPGLLKCDNEVLTKLCSTTIIDGHAPALSDKQLNAYLSAGIRTDHECETTQEVIEKVSKGMYVMIREGSQTKNLNTLLSSINDNTKRRLLFCTDDRYIEDIVQSGTIQNCIVQATDNGVDIFDAIAIASLNAYECYGIPNLGAIAIGYQADLVVADDLVPRNIVQVYKRGKLIAHNGKALFEAVQPDNSNVVGSVNIATFSHLDLQPDFLPNVTPVMQILKDTVVTRKVFCQDNDNLNMCAVIERHNATGNIGKCWVQGFELKGGAIAQTIGHDSHNITVIGDNTQDMALAVTALGKNGGMVLVVNGQVKYHLDLDIAGLMSSQDAKTVIMQHKELLKATEVLSINKEISPYMLLSFLSLIVIPDLKLSDCGLFDVTNFKFLT